MKKFYKFILVISLIITCIYQGIISANHLTGGSMSYEFVEILPDGRYKFRIIVEIYRDALSGGAQFDDPLRVTVFNMDNMTSRNISIPAKYNNITNIPINDLGPCARNVPRVSIEKIIYTYEDIISLNNNGYVYSHQRCCRSDIISNLIRPGDQGSTYSVHITRDAMLINNSSPSFNQEPPLLVCVGSNFEYQFAATDANGHRLRYYLCSPSNGGNSSSGNPGPTTMSRPPYGSVNFLNGYSATQPFGPNVEINLDPNTGTLKLRPDRVGIFTLAVCVDELDNDNQVINSVKRDIQFNIADCVVPAAIINPPIGANLKDDGNYATCKGLNNTFQQSSTGAQTYFWDFGVENRTDDTSTVKNPVFAYTDSGTYEIKLIINKGETCADSITFKLSVYPTLEVDFDFQTFCESLPVSFQSTSISSVDPIVDQTWSFSNDVLFKGTNFQHTFPGIGPYPVELAVETKNGCRDTIIKNITLPKFTKADFKIKNSFQQNSSDTFVVCSNYEIQLENSLPTDVPFVWKIDGHINNDQNPYHTFTDSGTYVIQLITNPNTPCADTLTRRVRVLPLPVADFSFVSSCFQFPVEFTTTTQRPFDAIKSVSWNFGDGTTSTELHPTKVYTSVRNYNVRQIITTIAGCKDTVTKTITVYPDPVADFNITGETFNQQYLWCDDKLPIQFTQTAVNAQTYDWTFGKNLGKSTESNPTFTFPEPGEYEIQLIVNKGNRCTDTIVKSIKTIDGITKTDFTLKDICVNTQQTFTNQSVAVKNDFTSFNWDFGNGMTSTEKSPRLPFSTPGTYNIKMIAETALGCRDSIQKSITIFPAPTVNFDNSDVCLNVENIFNNTSSIISGQIEKYQWSFGNLGTSTEKNAPFTFVQPGNVSVRLTATSDLGCSANITKTVKVRPAAKVDFDYTNHCFKAPVYFTDKSTSTNNDIVESIWTFEPGKTETGKNAEYVYSKADTYEVTLVIVSNIGCRDSITKTITIEDIPLAQFNIVGNEDENFTFYSCNGDFSVQFENTSDTDLKFLWNFGWNNSTSTVRDGYFIYPDTGTYTVRLYTEPGTACQDMMERIVRVIPPVEVDFSFDTECVLAPVFFKSIYNRNYDPIVEAFWDFGDGTTSTDFNPEKKYQRTGTYTVQLTLIAESGCSNTITKSITIQPEPKANFVTDGIKTSSGEFLKCEDLLGITFNNTSTLNNTNHWYFNDKNASSVEVSPTHYFSDIGKYDISLVINQGKICSDTITKTIDVVHGIEVVDFESSNSCVSTDIQFKDLSKARLNDIKTYLWDFGDKTTSNVKNPTKSYDLPGDYTVKLYVTTANGCIDSTEKKITIHPAPVSYFNVKSICLDQEIVIENLSTISSGNIDSNLWTFQNNPDQTVTNPTISYHQPGFYKITLTSVSDYGCTHTFVDTLEVKIPAQPQFTYINQCVSAPVEFKDATISSYNDIVAWEWTVLPGVVLNTQNPIYQYADAGTYPVQLTVISSIGCRDSVIQEIVTSPHPIADFVVDAMDKGNDLFVYCNDDKTISFNNESVDNLTNLWTTNNGFYLTTENASFTFPNIGTYQVKLTINDGTLCSDTKEIQIVVQPTLNVDFVHPTICEENAVIFTDNSSIATNDIINRTWKIEDAKIGTGLTIPYTFDTYGNYLVAVTVETEKGCIDSLSKTVKVEALPIVEVNITEACPQQVTQFDHQSQAVNNNSLSDFIWKFGDGSTSTDEKPAHIFEQPGSYELTFIVNTKAGCKDSIQDVIIVRDFVEPIIKTHVEILCQHQEIQFFSDESKGIFQNAVWDFGDGKSSSELNDINIYDEGGNYEVSLILKDALCGEFQTSKTIFIQDVPEISLGPDFALCPNLTTIIDLNNATLDSIFWSTGEMNTSQIVVNGNVGLVEVDAYYRGCLLKDSVYITPSCEISAPKVFTPNGDGLNDYFNLMPANVGTYQLFVFNRWGTQIFSTNDLNKGWDGTYNGKEQPMDNYTYYAVGTKLDGTPFTIEGAILLIR